MSTDAEIPSEGELYRRISDLVEGLAPEQVAAVLSARGLELKGPLPARRELVVRRLYCDGAKTGTESNDGPFAINLMLNRGPWVIASSINSAGKSSLLWALTFALRGEGFDEFCRPETVGWFRYVRADVEVAGVAVSIRLAFDRPGHPSARLLTADSIDQLIALEGRDEAGSGIHLSATAEPNEVKGLIGRFMMDRLGLQPMSVWVAEAGAPKDVDGNRDSTEQVHSWSSYFYAVALNSASDSILLGPTIVGQLPVKLMQLFLDVPYASEVSRLSTLLRAEQQEVNRVARRVKEDTQAREQRVEPLRTALTTAEALLREIDTARPDVTALVKAVETKAVQLAECQEEHGDALAQLVLARKNRQTDQRAARRARQSNAARLLLGALDPEACPRCDHEIDDARRATEDSEHQCAVCANPLPSEPEDPQAQADALAQIDTRLDVSQAAENTCRDALDTALANLAIARSAYDEARASLAAVQSDDSFTRFENAQREVYQLQGALAVASGGKSAALPALAGLVQTEPENKDQGDQPVDDEAVLSAAAEVLKSVVDARSRALFSELNDVIVQIAHDLGVTNLTSVNLTLGGQLNAVKSGARHRFSAFSPVDRLRMRIAVVVGMIRVGRRRGIMSHPGLLLIDAPTADELVPETTYQVLETLYRTGNEVPGLQMVITSIEQVVWDIFPEERILTGSARRELF